MEFFSCLQLFAAFEEILSACAAQPSMSPLAFGRAQQTKPHPIYREPEAMVEANAKLEEIFHHVK
ncbi:MAG: hypothetical protein E5V78_05090 [Mesorhizobium sp.]|nr:MAG: hypothetical protein EOS60_31510 [Mesorhizobium sp.]TIV88612.1 MAG: hypothetical protein E5V78_05090 [Mesorhizobium sp.]